MKRIQQLPTHLVNQIAAGEVIERPASVVKELLENSLDAGAKLIEIDIEKGGKQLIRIQDDGHGIEKDDLPLAIGSHATSKIRNLDDLEKINSLGFRGEALASISSVSRFNLQSRSQQSDEGWQIKLAAKEDGSVIQPAAHPIGSTVIVRDLFYNTPVRRKFLRADKTEFLHIEELIKRIALSRFDVGIHLRHNEKTILNVRPTKNAAQIEKRITKIFGKGFLDESQEVDVERVGLRLWGWLGQPSFHRSQNDCQYFYLNGRMVKDKLINHAVRQAYQDKIYPGRYAVYCLFLECDPQEVDVNVHPTKHEVRFQNARLVHDFIVQSLMPALQTEAVASLEVQSASPVSAEVMPAYQQFHQPSQPVVRERVSINPPESHQHSMGKLLAQLKPHYLLLDNAQGLLIIDALKCHQLMLKASLHETIKTQTLLIPEMLTFPEKTIERLQSKLPFLNDIGIIIDIIGEQEIVVREIPNVLEQSTAKEMVSQLIAGVLSGIETREQCISIMAQSAPSPNGDISRQLMNELFSFLESLDNWPSQNCCHFIQCESLFK